MPCRAMTTVCSLHCPCTMLKTLSEVCCLDRGMRYTANPPTAPSELVLPAYTYKEFAF